MDSNISSGIRAEESWRPRGIILNERNYRVWSAVFEQQIREKSLWGHIDKTYIPPSPARVITAAIAAISASPGSDAVTGAPAITKAMVDLDIKEIANFKAAEAKANVTLLNSLREKDIISLILIPSASGKWEKLRDDYATLSPGMASNAWQRFTEFRMKDGDSVVETIHRFDERVNECLIQAVNVTEEDKTRVLTTHPSEKWTLFMDSFSHLDPHPPVSQIFRAMKSQEERWNVRNEHEYADANFAGGGGPSNGDWKRRPKLQARQPITMRELRSCYGCGEPGHLSKDCPEKMNPCKICDKKGHTAKTCRYAKEEAEVKTDKEKEQPVAEEKKTDLPPSARRPRLSFAKGTKMQSASESAMTIEGMVAHVVIPEESTNEPEDDIEWLADSGAGRHVCNDLSLMWDVSEMAESVRLVGLLGEANVRFEGTVKLECVDDWGKPVVLHLYNTLFVPEANTNLFSLQRVRKADYTIVQEKWMEDFNGSCIKNGKGETVGYISEDRSGRGTVACRTLLPPLTDINMLLVLSENENDAESHPKEEAAGVPTEISDGNSESKPTLEIKEEEGVDDNSMLQQWMEPVEEEQYLVVEDQVEEQPPAEGSDAGYPAPRGEFPPTVVIGLPAAQIGKFIDWENEHSDESDFISLLVEDEETALNSVGSLPRRNNDSTCDDITTVQYEPTNEESDFELPRIGFGLRNPPSVMVNEMVVSHLCEGG